MTSTSRPSPLPRHPRSDVAAGALIGRDLTLSYDGAAVVREASVDLLEGRVTALVGPNGSGKSTLLRAFACLHRPSSGTLEFGDGSDAMQLARKDFARRVTMLAQSRATVGGVTVRDVVEFGRHPHRGRFRAEDPLGPGIVDHALELTGTTELQKRSVEQLSGGQLQRVWLASCLAQDTAVLLLDEPTTFLDLRYQVEILDLVRELADDHGVTIGIVLHDLDQAAAVADRVVLLSEGRVVADGTASEVFTTERLTATYGIRVDVDHDPTTGALRTRAIGRHHSRADALSATS